jgi:hypothetical protein
MEWRVVAVRKYPKEFTNEKDDETLPIINKLKQPKPKKGKYKEQKGRTHIQEDKKKTHTR